VNDSERDGHSVADRLVSGRHSHGDNLPDGLSDAPVKPTGWWMLVALNMKRIGQPMYEGTVAGHVIARRRASNKAARISRRRNRG